MDDVITKLIDNGERIYVPRDFINVLGENEPKERGMDNGDTCIRDKRLSFVFDRWGEGPKEPSEGYEPIIVIDCQESEDGVGDPMIIMYTYNGEIRVTSLICDSHADTYIYKII
tara:strand:+ start:284 stop:625 length:342 start_codon:yes stop_codon:yes gene_type:complete